MGVVLVHLICLHFWICQCFLIENLYFLIFCSSFSILAGTTKPNCQLNCKTIAQKKKNLETNFFYGANSSSSIASHICIEIPIQVIQWGGVVEILKGFSTPVLAQVLSMEELLTLGWGNIFIRYKYLEQLSKWQFPTIK